MSLTSDRGGRPPVKYDDVIRLPDSTSRAQKGRKSGERFSGYLTDPYAFEGQSFVYIYYGKDKNDLTQLATATADGDHFSIKLTNLLPNTTYYYQGSSLCILSFGLGDWFYSAMKSFTTKP